MFIIVVMPLWLNKFFWCSEIDESHRRVGQGTTFSRWQSQNKGFIRPTQCYPIYVFGGEWRQWREGQWSTTQVHQATMLREVKAKKNQCCSWRLLWGLHFKEAKKEQPEKQPERLINTCQTDQHQLTALHGQDANNTKVTNCYSDRYYGNWE